MHESTTDTTISTNGDYSVFVNQPKDFFLKLTLIEADSTQIRNVELSSIFDEERNKASYGKLVDRIVAAVGYDINVAALKLTYQDFEDDAVVVSSTQELTHAIRQFYDKGIMKFVGNVQRETQINHTLLPLSVVVPALPNSHHAPGATEASAIPKDFIVDYPTTSFDPSRAASGLTLDDDNRRVTQTIGDGNYKCIYLKDGITSGCKYWSFRIINKGSSGDITIGVGDSTCDLTQNAFPGFNGATGCSLYLGVGKFFYIGTSSASTDVSRVKNATIIGLLVDMNHQTVTFYADGERVGTGGADANVLTTGREYFPVVSLYSQGQCVEVMDLVPPTSH